jgi:hypothetical protein
MVSGAYRELFTAIATAAAALTGLLFVAISVAPRPTRDSPPDVIRQVRAAASLLSFTNPLVVTLFGLVPGTNVGYPATAMGIIGLLFTSAGLRSILGDPAARRRVLGQFALIVLLMATFGIELVAGCILLVNAHHIGALTVVCNVLVASLLIGVARAWELVGDRDTGIIASIAALAGRERHLGGLLGRPASGPESGPAGRDSAAGPDHQAGLPGHEQRG